MVTSVERGGAVDVSSDEGRLLFPHSVIPHPPDTTLYTGEERRERKRGKMRERRCGQRRRSGGDEGGKGNKGKGRGHVEGRDDKIGEIIMVRNIIYGGVVCKRRAN